MKCSICKESIQENRSNNAEPVNSGRCCDSCNMTVVIPARLAMFLSPDFNQDNIVKTEE